MQNLEMRSMAVSTPAAYGMYPHDVELHQVVQTLNQSGIGKEDICMMVSPSHPFALLSARRIISVPSPERAPLQRG